MISRNNILQEVNKKYPFLIDQNSGLISLVRIGDIIRLINEMDDSQLIYLGLQNFKEDLKWIVVDAKELRKNKLEKINKLERQDNDI